MNAVSRGFTLIELIAGVLVLGILAAAALPRVADLGNDALGASLAKVAGALSTASSINLAAFQANSAKAVRLNSAVCRNAALSLLLTGGLPAGSTASYLLSGAETCANQTAGTLASCTLSAAQGASSATAGVSVLCTG